ncbi:MAG: ABC transporter substrate-binding protein [Chloroflexota bacterium]
MARLSRRDFLGSITILGASAVVAACASSAAPTPTAAPKSTEPPKPAATSAPAASAAPAATQAPAQAGAAKPFAGVTLNGSFYELTSVAALKTLLPDFEQQSGIKVNLEVQAFAVHNQRMDLALSAKDAAYDISNITFAYANRWVGSGWFTNLEEFIKDPNKTPKEWDADDFNAGAMVPFLDAKKNRCGFAYDGSVMVTCAARGDVVEKSGLPMPKTFDDLVKLLDAIHDKEGVKAFVADNLHHWCWAPFLMGFGGNVFKAAPDNLTPMLDSKESIESAEWYANILRKYCPDGVLSYTNDQALTAQAQARANIRIQSISWFTPMVDPAKSTVSKTLKFARVPAGPKGDYPAGNSMGVGIPIGSKKKEAAWEFIKWMCSKETVKRLAIEKLHPGPCRTSVINSPEFKKAMTINGHDLASEYITVLDLIGKTGYMLYRTVSVFPPVGTAINKAIEAITTKQLTAEAAMKQAQQDAIADIKKAGVKIDA